MEYIKEIIRRYFQTKYPSNIESKIQRWLCSREHWELKEQALFAVWNSIPTNCRYNKDSWRKVSFKLGFAKPLSLVKTYIKLSAVASVLILLGFGIVLWEQRSEMISRQLVLQTVYTKAGEYKTIILPDSSLTHLSASSKISYYKPFHNTIRKIKLEGEAFFKVTHNPSAPFIVETSHFKVKVLGTQFKIKDYKDENLCITLLKSGAISVLQKQSYQQFSLRPGDKLTYDNRSGKVTLIQKEYMRNTHLAFDNASLHSITKTISQQLGINIIYRGKAPEKYTITFTEEQTVEEILNTLVLLDDKIHWKKEGNQYIVFTK